MKKNKIISGVLSLIAAASLTITPMAPAIPASGTITASAALTTVFTFTEEDLSESGKFEEDVTAVVIYENGNIIQSTTADNFKPVTVEINDNVYHAAVRHGNDHWVFYKIMRGKLEQTFDPYTDIAEYDVVISPDLFPDEAAPFYITTDGEHTFPKDLSHVPLSVFINGEYVIAENDYRMISTLEWKDVPTDEEDGHNIHGKAVVFDYGEYGTATYRFVGCEPVLSETTGERSNGPLIDKMIVPSNAKKGDNVYIKGISCNGEEVAFDYDIKKDGAGIPVGDLITGKVYNWDKDTDIEIVDQIKDGAPIDRDYIAARPLIAGGDYTITDNNGNIIKSGNILDDHLVIREGDTAEFKTTIDPLNITNLSELGFTSVYINNIVRSGAIYIEFNVEPLYWCNTANPEDIPRVNCEYNKLAYDNTALGYTIEDNWRYDGNDIHEIVGELYPRLHTNISGDANNDGELNIADAVTVQKWLLGDKPSDMTVDSMFNVNLCKDDRLDVFDMCLLKQKLINNG